ncbi:MAG: tagatose-bisphosphate aldolase [Anaerolineae bacterium]|nr:MAG: tagatose-bisphosphate aldolase [Anaerolineae bacterium]
MHYLDYLAASHHFGPPLGLTSVCSAHPLVIEAALRSGLAHGKPVLLEATCNQVNQFGGYTGQTPADFLRFVLELADTIGFPRQNLILGGDHLGPLPWADEPPQQAMEKAKALVRAYVQAGFTKIHLDCSMPLGGEPWLSPEIIAQRAAELALAAESALPAPLGKGAGGEGIRYVIGSEVPAAGGAKAGEAAASLTRPADAAQTLELTRRAFLARGLDSAWERVIALVVQPGIEFGAETIHAYDPLAAAPLARFIETVPGLVYEAHSTDYQTPAALRALVRDHFAILKVGPALTFALREALFALEDIEIALGAQPPSRLRETLEAEMLANPVHWQKHYSGDAQAQQFARAYSFSDRIRYYWNTPAAQSAVRQLMENLGERPLPLALLSQYLPGQYEKVRRGERTNHPRELLLGRVMDVLEIYALVGFVQHHTTCSKCLLGCQCLDPYINFSTQISRPPPTHLSLSSHPRGA